MNFKILIPIKFINAKLHLKYKCPRCPQEIRQKRDIHNQGECHWFTNWNKGNHDLQFYFVHLLKNKLKIFFKQ